MPPQRSAAALFGHDVHHADQRCDDELLEHLVPLGLQDLLGEPQVVAHDDHGGVNAKQADDLRRTRGALNQLYSSARERKGHTVRQCADLCVALATDHAHDKVEQPRPHEVLVESEVLVGVEQREEGARA